jgi:hypothetical protein
VNIGLMADDGVSSLQHWLFHRCNADLALELSPVARM